MEENLSSLVEDAIRQHFNPPGFWCARKACSNTSRTATEGGMCSRCQEHWTWDEVRQANLATKLGFSPGTFFSDIATMLGRSLEELEALDRDQLAALWDSVGLSSTARPLSPAERRQIAEGNEQRLADSRRRQQERHLAAAEQALVKASRAFEEAQKAARWSPEEIERVSGTRRLKVNLETYNKRAVR